MRIYCFDRTEGHAKVRLEIDGVDRHSIEGRIRGPFCCYSRTLPCNQSIRGGEARVVDPCYWTPRLPFLYEARLRYESEGSEQEVEFMFGLRWCIVDGANLRLCGKRFVVRAVSAGQDPDLGGLRDTSSCLLMTEYVPDVCEEASKVGVMVIAAPELDPGQLQHAQRCPAVHFSCGKTVVAPDVIPLHRCGNAPSVPSVCLTDEVDVLKNQPASAVSRRDQRPKFVLRQAVASPEELRRECDYLQRDVAKYGQFAGYLAANWRA